MACAKIACVSFFLIYEKLKVEKRSPSSLRIVQENTYQLEFYSFFEKQLKKNSHIIKSKEEEEKKTHTHKNITKMKNPK